MHFHFPFTAVEILWTLTFAAQLVLLVVLLGRDRIRRFRWFTASIVVLALRLLVGKLLADRVDRMTLGSILIPLADISVIVGFGVLVELALKAFRGVKRNAWIVATVVILAIGGVALRYWGIWPHWSELAGNSRLTVLLVMQLFAQKGEVLLDFLAIELCLLIVLFASPALAGWRTHVRRIAIGLAVAALGQLGAEGSLIYMSKHFVPKSRQEYDHLLDTATRITQANSILYVVVLLWWIACLWFDEPGTVRGGENADPAPVMTPVGSPPVLKDSARAHPEPEPDES
jgi:hypothetical protein